MRTVLLVAGAWVGFGSVAALVLGRALWRLRRARALEDRLSELAIRDRLRPRGGHVEAAPIEPPIEAPAFMNGGRKVTEK